MKRDCSILVLLFCLGIPSVCAAQFVAGEGGEIQTVTLADVRVAGDMNDLPSGGLVGDENGGFTSLVVGINDPGGGVPGVDNFALVGFDTSDPSGLLTGETILGAEITFFVQTGFGGGANHGTADDTLSIHSLYASNSTAGWDPGTATIRNNAATVAPDGVVNFRERVFNIAGGEWLDASGAAVDNFLGAFDGTTALNDNTINGWVSGAAPETITFEISDLALIQGWINDGYADIVLQVNDDGSATSRFNLTNGGPTLEILIDSQVLLGDVNLDGEVTFLDIAPFIAVLSGDTFQAEADCDENGLIEFLDIAPFIDILSAP